MNKRYLNINLMKKSIILILALLTYMSYSVKAQSFDNNITGVVVDKWGSPVYGASVYVLENPNTKVETDRNGHFEILANEGQRLEVLTFDNGSTVVPVGEKKYINIVLGYKDQAIDVGANKVFARSESTASVSTLYNEEFDLRSTKNISNSILGSGGGLVSLQNSGIFVDSNPTFYVRGLQSLSNSNPLVLVDGLERDINLVSTEEVESVSVLKDAAAVALYGYKGVNGAILITTKRGKYNTREISFSYDHVSNFLIDRPEFADAFTYAKAINEARAYEGLGARYTDQEISAFRSGAYPYLYPNVNWVDETFKNSGVSNKYMLEFRGGGSKFRYYTLLNLLTDKGFIKSPNENEGYSTQNKYSRANLRINLDVDLTKTTKLKLNLLGTLSESSRPGDSANLWDLVYSLPSAAFPVYSEEGLWGGNATWPGTQNPVAQSQGAAYSKGHTRNLYGDLTLEQDLSSIIKGLGANFRISYDNYSSVWEKHHKTFMYGSSTPGVWEGGVPTIAAQYTGGADSEMSSEAMPNAWTRLFNFAGSFNYDQSFGRHDIYSQMKWDYEYRNTYGLNTTIYRQNVSWYTHYGYNKKYFADLALVTSGSNLLAPGHKWAFSPTVSFAWILSEEDFMKRNNWIDFLKLRASWGIINADYLPRDGDNTVHNYWDQIYNITGVTYPFNSGYDSDFGSTTIGRLATLNPTHEKAFKYNIGIDAVLFKDFNIIVDGYFQRRKDIWVPSSGKYTDILGLQAPFENGGIVDSWGIEASLDYIKRIGNVRLNLGGNILYNKNKIKEQLEEPRLYPNLVKTGNSLNQIYGLQAIGYFRSQEEIDASPVQTFNKVIPGDIKYKDVNKDGIIDENDAIALGYNAKSPEIYYSFKLGAEWKGLGFNAMFQGTARYSAILNAKSLFVPLIDNNTISKHYYDNRWTPDTPDARYPRLSSQSNNNNNQVSSVWVVNRSFLKLRNIEVYYKIPKNIMERTKFIDNAKFYVRGIDLFSLDTMNPVDPEAYGVGHPLTRSLVVGLAVGF